MMRGMLDRASVWFAEQPGFPLGVLVTGVVSVVFASVPRLVVLGLLGGLVSVLLAVVGVVVDAFRTGDVRGRYRLLALGVLALLLCVLVACGTIGGNPGMVWDPWSLLVRVHM